MPILPSRYRCTGMRHSVRLPVSSEYITYVILVTINVIAIGVIIDVLLGIVTVNAMCGTGIIPLSLVQFPLNLNSRQFNLVNLDI